MKITGEHRFDASRQVVWEAVLDPEVLTKVLPGCEDFHRKGAPDEHKFAGVLKIKVGPVQGKFKGDVELSDLEPPSSYRLALKGRGAPGFVDGAGSLRLEDADGGGTLLRYDIDAKVGGRIASVGQRLLDSSTKVVTRQALEGLDEQVRLRADVVAAEREAAEARAAAEAAEAAESDGGETTATEGETAVSEAAESHAAESPAAESEIEASDASESKTEPRRVEAETDADAAAAHARAEAARARQRAETAEARAEAARLRARESEAPSHGAFAWKMTRGMVEELIGDDKRSTALAGVAAAVLVVILLVFKGC
ncbi:MAG: carbon monoxide dehydrogenase subunit G [Acidobacteriota bacterium]